MTRNATFYEDKFPFIDSSYKIETGVPSLPLIPEIQEDLIIDGIPSDQAIMPSQPTIESYSSDADSLPLRHSTRSRKSPPGYLTL